MTNTNDIAETTTNVEGRKLIVIRKFRRIKRNKSREVSGIRSDCPRLFSVLFENESRIGISFLQKRYRLLD